MIDLFSAFLTAITLITTQNPDVMEITYKTLQITFSSVLISTIIALPLGTAINFSDFRGKKTLISLIQTLYALPTVIVGLVCFMLLSRTGPLGFLGFLFTPSGMIFGQAFLVIPIMTGLTIAALQGVSPTLTDTIRSLGATKGQFLIESPPGNQVCNHAAIVIGFSRALSEVGAAIMIGGNIKGTYPGTYNAISLQTSMGNFELSLALGVILLGIALVINMIMGFLQQR